MRQLSREDFIARCDPEMRAAIEASERATGNALRVYEMHGGDLLLDYSTPGVAKTGALAPVDPSRVGRSRRDRRQKRRKR